MSDTLRALTRQRDGAFQNDFNRAIERARDEVRRTGRPASIAVTITIDPLSSGQAPLFVDELGTTHEIDGGLVKLGDDIVATLPMSRPPLSGLFGTEGID